MYKWEGLNNTNINLIKNINISDEYDLQANLSSVLNSNNILKRFLLWRNIKFLKLKNQYVGFIWFNKLSNNRYKINSIFVMSEFKSLENYKALLGAIKKNSIATYFCKSSDIEYYIFKKLGFDKKRAIVEMKKTLKFFEEVECDLPISFYRFQKNKDEKLRCNVQNQIFSDLSRYPIDEEDVYFEENQKYYLNDGCIFIKHDESVAGYGQIIADKGKAYLVNFGILEKYRGKGLGKLLLNYLSNLCYNMGYKEIYLKCNESNSIALQLYETMGFIQWDLTYELYKIV